MMIVLLYLYVIIFLIEIGLIMSFVLKFKPNEVKSITDAHLSILVCARNEESNLPCLIDSLLASDYPLSEIEILIGDDQSTDGTPKVIKEYADQNRMIKYVSIKDEKDGLIAKGNVLAQLVDQSKFDKVLIIDADMKVDQQWMSTMSGLLDQFDLISGYTMIDKKSDVVGDQFFDWAVVLHTMKAMSDAFRSISILGNNMGFVRSAYDQVNGFRGLGPTDVEDLGLLRNFQKQDLMAFQFIGSLGIAYSRAQQDYASVLTQRVRWMNGVFTHHWLLAIPAFFARLWFLIGLIALIFSKWAAFILIFGFLVNLIKYRQVMTKSGGSKKFRILSPASISLLDTFALFYRIFIGKVSWKGRKF